MFRSSLSPRPRRGRRPLAAAVAALVLAVTAAACEPPPPQNPPFWHPGTTVDATVHGPLVRIQWDATTGGDPVSAYQISLGTYSGTVVALVPASVRDCYISGLAASTPQTIVVTARDAQMHWSGPLSGTQGRRTTTVTTSSHGGAGPNLWCHAAVDTDGDGLPNGVETNDGVYQGAGKTGTDPDVADTDNDGLPDGIEVLGKPGLDLVAMGVRPTHKDLLIETDWISHAPCSTQPTSTKLAPMVSAFANAPTNKVTNPDGTQGIKLIVDYGQGGHFTGGNQVPDPDSTLDGRFTGQNVNGSHFAAAKAAHFDPIRKDIFHYSITHGAFSGASTAEQRGDDTYVSGACGSGGYPLQYSGMLMHEIGHNFGISHGGTNAGIPGGHLGWFCDGPSDTHCISKTSINWKPNYVSVMNYMYLIGLDDSCRDQNLGPWAAAASLWLDYSSGTRAPLHENALDETTGICNGVPFDFDDDGVIDPTPYQGDVTFDDHITPLHDHDDWSHIEATGLTEFVGDD